MDPYLLRNSVRSIGGGTVRYRGITWLAHRDLPIVVGDSTSVGTVEILWDGRVVESFDVQPSDSLLVADGTSVPPGTYVIERPEWIRYVRADLPPGTEATVRWSEAHGHDT
jgi:hypothetical protein